MTIKLVKVFTASSLGDQHKKGQFVKQASNWEIQFTSFPFFRVVDRWMVVTPKRACYIFDCFIMIGG